MPVKYSIYKTACIINLILLFILFLSVIFRAAESGLKPEDIFPLFLALLYFFIYTTNNYFGLRLLAKYASKEGISQREKRNVIILYVPQLLIQLFMAYVALENIDFTIDLIRTGLIGILFREIPELILLFFPYLIFLITIYMEIHTFSLIKSVERQHALLITGLDEIGQS